ncbi:hypothetical protein K491DRAFT_717393 [Lophiostoma macrostomum CBS 122681]|uniref:Uncharacterized protein n=1 Tax=Lophiostoma macrostomum CBS 122681 TaxID=1314788 RepID=A0A6A6T2B2_9PLEO|nr:hypothetical protein K491DRAFT_717393 [Lophiostoma macrostomum CBS 122681]
MSNSKYDHDNVAPYNKELIENPNGRFYQCCSCKMQKDSKYEEMLTEDDGTTKRKACLGCEFTQLVHYYRKLDPDTWRPDHPAGKCDQCNTLPPYTADPYQAPYGIWPHGWYKPCLGYVDGKNTWGPVVHGPSVGYRTEMADGSPHAICYLCKEFRNKWMCCGKNNARPGCAADHEPLDYEGEEKKKTPYCQICEGTPRQLMSEAKKQRCLDCVHYYEKPLPEASDS